MAEVYRHKHMNAIAEILERTNRGYKVIFTDNSGKKPKTTTQYFDKIDFDPDKGFFEKVETMEQDNNQSDEAFLAEIEAKIREACEQSKYIHLCNRVQSEGGMAFVLNRCIHMMAKDGLQLSTALAFLESEFETGA